MKKSIPFFCSLSFFVINIFLFTTCTKDYSYEGGAIVNGTSTGKSFTLLGAGSTCTGSVLSGNYYAGIPLISANTIQLKVHVDSIGSYDVSTSSADGFMFSGSGNFIDTGIQIIVLQGSGIPTAEGSFTFTPPVGLGCTFTVTVSKIPASFAKFSLVGDPNLCPSVVVTGMYTAGYQINSNNYVQVLVNVASIGTYTIATNVVDGMSFSVTGTFTKVGLQPVVLLGSGTPQLPNYVTFTPMGDSTSCRFNVPVLNPDPQATYVLESGFGNPNPCIYAVAGNYIAVKPLSATNTVSVNAYVTVLGNFTIATNTVNGMTFSYTGTFTTVGSQKVILLGNGTPVTSGTFSFTPQIVGPSPLGGASCAFNVMVQ